MSDSPIDDHVATLASLSEQLAAHAAGKLDAPAAHLGEWSIRDVVEHVGRVYAYATGNVLAASTEPTPPDVPPTPQGDEIIDWFDDRRRTVLDALTSAPPDRVAWSHAGVQDVAWWRRRMMHETAIHLFDVQAAAGDPQPIERSLAVDGIDEYLDVSGAVSAARPGRVYPADSLHLHCTDGHGEWMIERGAAEHELVWRHEHGKGAVAVRGTASDLLLWIWGRPTGPLEMFGDPEVAAAWQALAP